MSCQCASVMASSNVFCGSSKRFCKGPVCNLLYITFKVVHLIHFVLCARPVALILALIWTQRQTQRL